MTLFAFDSPGGRRDVFVCAPSLSQAVRMLREAGIAAVWTGEASRE